MAPLPKRLDLKELVAIFISICALAVSFYAIYQSGITLHASVQPLLDTYISDFHDQKAVILHNYGLGPAVITNVTFYNNTTNSENIGELIYLPYHAEFNEVHSFGEDFEKPI